MLHMGAESPQTVVSRRSGHSDLGKAANGKISEMLTLLLLAIILSAAVLQV